MLHDAIVALATARGFAHRAVLRISGVRALEIAAEVFQPADGSSIARSPGGTVVTGSVSIARGGERVQASAWIFRAPRSYTGEDVVELHLPGSPLLCEVVQERLVKAGARVAEPGEFTRRTFVNGKIDLTRAEAVLALIRARTDAERRCALILLEGGLERRVAALRDLVLEALVPLELALDFSDQDLEILEPRAVRGTLSRLESALSELASETGGQAPARTLFRVVLEGPANAGKSSLFNRLVGREAAIVAPHPGTTRDPLVGESEADGVRMLLVDTAGGDVTGSEADRLAHLQRARRLREADLVLEVRDARSVGPGRAASRPGRLRVLTHADLVAATLRPGPGEALVSNVTGAGLGSLRAQLAATLRAEPEVAPAPLLVNARHAAAFEAARAAAGRAAEGLAEGRGAELVASDLRAALAALLSVTGEDAPQAVLDRVFAGFCIGK